MLSSRRNLNHEEIPWAGPLVDFGGEDPECKIKWYFKDIEDALVEEIGRHSMAVGCVAWLTNSKILAALSGMESVSIVVQKEDFLRPDLDRGRIDNWKRRLRDQYGSLRSSFERHMFTESILSEMSCCTDPIVDAVRCAGVRGGKHVDGATPRMHHKFIVFIDRHSNEEKSSDQGKRSYGYNHDPVSVWTGSFNFTANSTASIENAVLIQSRAAAKSYMLEWGQVAALSEPLDWTSEYVDPEWRIGT